ncbi:cellulose synthase operon protein YhjQ/BcsQ [Acidocella sp.]|uniref:AAA family ATPase n=1 Tax=Acidocella sp. TaxID=50710 RepID=UPI0026053E17|nr:cellulose synthase operon protein YhjQ/BcsQ [Acidocella sp.]
MPDSTTDLAPPAPMLAPPLLEAAFEAHENPAAMAPGHNFARPAAAPRPGIKRDKFIGFARDEASANLLHDALAGYLPNTNQVHVLDFRSALSILAAMTTPEIVLVDLSGEDQPLNAIMELADVVEAGTVVLTLGENQSLNFYRTVTKGLGIKDYLPKPLTKGAIEQHFLPVIANIVDNGVNLRTGRALAVAGARGGVGTSTIAANLAWYLSQELHRHTVLMDGELSTGTIALNLDVAASNGLAVALETPERVDQLLIERSMRAGGDRLHVLAALEALDKPLSFSPDSAASFLQNLRSRYNYVIADAGARLEPFGRALLFNVQQRIIVMDPSMISIRNLTRLMTLPGGSSQSTRVMLVLNKAGAPGGLAQSYMEQTMGLRFDAVIPDLPRIVPRTTQLGAQAATLRGPFRNGIATLAQALGAVTPAV